jgi:hypothetical protein
MIEVKTALRTAYFGALQNNINYLGVNIPMDQDFFNGVPATLPIGNSTQVQAYVIFQNQTVNDNNSPFCHVNQNTSCQLDIITRFNANSGNSYHAEQITQKIFDLLFTSDPKRIIFTLTGLNMWRGWLESSRALVQETSDERIFRNILIFQHSISQ